MVLVRHGDRFAATVYLLGGERAFGIAPCSELDMHWALLDRLPFACVSAFEARLGPEAKVQVPELVDRRVGETLGGGPDRLPRRAGDKLYVVARALAGAMLHLGSLAAAERFLLTRPPVLGGASRFDLLATPPGARFVDDALAASDPRDAMTRGLSAEAIAKAGRVAFRREMEIRSGGLLTRDRVADLLGTTADAVEARRIAGTILGLAFDGETLFPAAQIVDGVVVPHLAAVLGAFGDMHPWGVLQLLVAPSEGFSDEPQSILQLLASDPDLDTVDQLCGLIGGWAQ